MKSTTTLALLACLATIALTAGTGQAADPIPSPSAPAPARGVWLVGAFGKVAGGTEEAPARVRPTGDPLDAFVRSAPLRLESGSLEVVDIVVTARPLDGGPVSLLTTEAGPFQGPDSTGRYLITARLTGVSGGTRQVVWDVRVPDRVVPEDGLLDIPAPDTIFNTSADRAVGAAGDGCYLYLCVDVGLGLPTAQLPRLTAAPGELLTASLADGSAIVSWDGRLEPLEAGTATGLASSGGDGTSRAAVELHGLEVPGDGDWLLVLTVTFDRERGWMESRLRLSAAAEEDQAPAGSGTFSGAGG